MPNTITNEGNNNLNFQDVTNSTIKVHQNSIPKLPKELTLNIPKIHLSKVVGREHELEDLHQLLFDNKHVVLVNGLGGIGKTTLAQAYMSQYYDEYQHIVWISQNSEHSIESDFINTEGLKENLSIDTRGKDLPMLFNEILLKLKALTDKPNLLLIDNTETSLSKLLPSLPQQPNWHLLVTSREHIEHFYPKELGYLSPEKALALFKTHCLLIKDDQAIEELLEVIDYHTLTIEILAKTATVQRKSIAELKNAITNDLKANVTSDHNKGNKIDKVRSYLSSIFNLGKLNTHEIWLMKQLACLPPEPHSFELLHELIAPENEYEETFAETLNELVKKGWLMHYSETDSFKMHRIIAEVTAPTLNIELKDIENLFSSISQKLEIDQTKDNPIDKFQWISFGKAILVHFENKTDSIITLLQNNLALVLKDLGYYQEAKTLLQQAEVLDENNFGRKHPTTAVTYSNLALVLQSLGDYEGAKKLLLKAVIADEINFGEIHPNTTARYSNLALVLRDLGDYQEAKKLLLKVVIADKINFGEMHPKTAISYSNLGIVLNHLGDYKEAKKLLLKAVTADETNFGEKHPTTAIRYSNLGIILSDLGNYQEAKKLLLKAMIADEINFGEMHPNTAIRYSNLATVLQKLGDYQEAKKLLQKATISAEIYFGEIHPKTATRYSNLALVLQDLGDYEEAKILLQKAMIATENNFGEKHPTTAVRYSNLAAVLQDLGDYEGAKRLFLKAMISDENNFGKNHPNTARAYANLAISYFHLNNRKNAIVLLEKAYDIYKSHFGDTHPFTKKIKRNLDYIQSQIN